METKKPKCKLTDCDGNVFALAGRVSRCLKQAGQQAQAQEFKGKFQLTSSYDEALQLMMSYVDVC